MADFSDVIKTADEATAGFANVIASAEGKIFAEAVTLMKDLETDGQGNIKQTIANLKKVATIKSKLAKIVDSPEWKAGVGKFLEYFSKVQKEQTRYFSEEFPNKTLSENAKKRDEVMKQMAVDNTIEGLMGAGLQANVTDKLGDMLLRAVTSNAKFADLQNEFREFLTTTEGGSGALSRYATTYSVTTLSQFTGQNNKILTDDLGLVWFMYVGSTMERTRDFCQHLTRKKYVHISEIPQLLKGEIEYKGKVHTVPLYSATKLPQGMIAGTNEANFQVNCGGWNCRHQLVPIDEMAVPEELREKFKDWKSEEEQQVSQHIEKHPIDIYSDKYKSKIQKIEDYLALHSSGKVQANFDSIKYVAGQGDEESLEKLIEEAHKTIKINESSIASKAKKKALEALQTDIDDIVEYISEHPKSGKVASAYGNILAAKKAGDIDAMKKFIDEAKVTISKNEASIISKAKNKAEKKSKAVISGVRKNAIDVLAQMKGAKGLDAIVKELENALDSNDEAKIELQYRMLKSYMDKYVSLTYLENPLDLAKKFTYQELSGANDAIKNMFAKVAGKKESEKASTFEYEAKWVSDHKKYSTWEIVSNAYTNAAKNAKNNIAIQNIIDSAKDVINYNNPTPKIQAYINEINNAIKLSDTSKIKNLVESAKIAIKEEEERRVKELMKNLGNSTSKIEKYCDKHRSFEYVATDQASFKAMKETHIKYTYNAWINSPDESKKAIIAYGNGSYGRVNSSYWRDKVGCEDGVRISKMLDQCVSTKDMVIRRGSGFSEVKSIFGQKFYDIAVKKDVDMLNKLSGWKGVNEGFISTSFDEFGGFGGDVNWVFYAPKGTQMAYALPFVPCGEGRGMGWNGDGSDTYHVGSENEFIVNRGYQYRFVRSELGGSHGASITLYCELLDRNSRTVL